MLEREKAYAEAPDPLEPIWDKIGDFINSVGVRSDANNTSTSVGYEIKASDVNFSERAGTRAQVPTQGQGK
jgi:hypothetical protein